MRREAWGATFNGCGGWLAGTAQIAPLRATNHRTATTLCAHTRRDPGIFSRILSLAASKDWGKALPLACVGIEILAESPIVLFVRARPDIVNNDDRRPKQDS